MRHFPTIDKREWLGGWVASGSRSSGKHPYFFSRGRIQRSAVPLWFMAKAAKLGQPNILTAPYRPPHCVLGVAGETPDPPAHQVL